MRHLIILPVLLVATPWETAGQDPPAGGDKVQVVTFSVSPAHAQAFETAIEKIVLAAGRARIAPEHGWRIWANDYSYRLFSRIPSMAYFDDPELWIRQFTGTRGQRLLEQGMAELDTLESRITMNEVFESVPTWDYVPLSAAEPRYVDVREYWLKPGQPTAAAFDSLAAALVALYADVGWVYPVRGYRVLLGDVARLVVQTYYDNRSDYFGAQSIDTLVRHAGAEHRWDELQTRLAQLLLRTRRFEEVYRPALSYVPYPF